MSKLEPSEFAAQLSKKKKRTAILDLSEDDFRDRVVYPVYERIGLKFLRENCGPDEQGKDGIFYRLDEFGDTELIGIQTKKGPVNLAGTNPGAALTNIVTQLRMTLDTSIVIDNKNLKKKPTVAHLCASGPISNNARSHMNEQLESHRIKIHGCDELIPMIDDYYPEFWYGIGCDLFPYCRKLQEKLMQYRDTILVSDINPASKTNGPISDENFIPLKARVIETSFKKSRGKNSTKPEIRDVSVDFIWQETSKKILLTGEGGSGKSTSLRRIAYKLSARILGSTSNEVPIPILLKAEDISSDDNRLSDIAVRFASKIAGGKSPFSDIELSTGAVIILIDALDEVDSDERKFVLSKVADFQSQFGKCKVVISTRDYASIVNLCQSKGFTRLNLVPLGLREAELILKRVGSKKKPLNEDTVRETIRRLHDVHGLSLSPMLVTIFAASSDFTKQDIPPNITEMFKKFTELMLGRWDEKKGIEQQHHAPIKDFVLQQLAKRMHASRSRTLPIDEVRVLFAAIINERGIELDCNTLFDEITNRSGLLNSIDGEVYFKHHLLQEFFAGRAMSHLDATDHLDDEWWRLPIVFHFGDTGTGADELAKCYKNAEMESPQRWFDAAVTVGLALQACYMSELSVRLDALTWVIQSLADHTSECARSLCESSGDDRPLLAFTSIYLVARDAVAAKIINKLPDEATDKLLLDSSNDLIVFWKIVGLIESGHLEEACEEMGSFDPEQRECLLALELGLLFAQHTRPCSKKTSKMIESRISNTRPKITNLHDQLRKEVQSLLLEWRKGEIYSIPEVSDDE